MSKPLDLLLMWVHAHILKLLMRVHTQRLALQGTHGTSSDLLPFFLSSF